MNLYTVGASELSSADIGGVVAIHRREIGQGFLSSLGDKALELLFSLAAESETGVLLVARHTTHRSVCGFLLGTTNTAAFYRAFLRSKSLKALVVLLPKMLSLSRVRKVIETLIYPSKTELQDLPEAELLDIAVSVEHQGTGLAQKLFYEFVGILEQKGIREFKITTGESLVQAQRFYEKLGAEKVATTEVHRGQVTIVYVYRIPGAPIHNQG